MERLATTISVVAAVGIIAAVIIGPLGFGLVRFHLNRNAIVQYQGSEIVMLAVAVTLLVTAWLWLNNSHLAPALAVGPALFVIYTFITVVMPQEYVQFPDGNTERFMLIYFGLTALASMLVALCINALIPMEIIVTNGWRRATQWILGVQAGLFFLMWMGQILGTYRNGMPKETEQARALFWLVKCLDLGFAIPVAVITILLLQSQQPLSAILVLAFEGFTTCMLIAIAAMAVSLWWQNESGGSLPLAIGMMLFAIPAALIWTRWIEAIRV